MTTRGRFDGGFLGRALIVVATLPMFAAGFRDFLNGRSSVHVLLIMLLCATLMLAYLVPTGGVRCSRCGQSLRSLVASDSSRMKAVDPRIRYCPFCGAALDAEDTAKPDMNPDPDLA
jgi:hypothetical protein